MLSEDKSRLSSVVRNSWEFQSNESALAAHRASGHSLEWDADKIFRDLPNDLTRLVYLASIRDYNTGRYLHAELSRSYDADAVHLLLSTYHGQIFEMLVGVPVSDYVDQVRLYASFSGTPPTELVRTWRTLEPYKVAVPLGCDRLAEKIFYLNMFTALCIVGNSQDHG